MARLTEAGQLYLQDIAVLEEARGDLETFMNQEFWEPFKVDLANKAKETLGRDKKLSLWKSNTEPGHGTQFVEVHPATLAIRVRVCAPFKTQSNNIDIFLAITKGGRDKLKKISGGFEQVSRIAKSHGIELDWERDGHIISRISFPMDIANMTETREQILEHLQSVLIFLSGSGDWSTQNS